MASDAITLIKADHRILVDLVEQLRDPSADRTTLLGQLAARMLAHAHAEEEAVYPALVAQAPAEVDEIELGIEEHREAERQLRALQQIDPSSAEFTAALRTFTEAVTQHVDVEEMSILPELTRVLDPAALRELGDAYERCRQEKLRAHGVHDEMAEALREQG